MSFNSSSLFTTFQYVNVFIGHSALTYFFRQDLLDGLAAGKASLSSSWVMVLAVDPARCSVYEAGVINKTTTKLCFQIRRNACLPVVSNYTRFSNSVRGPDASVNYVDSSIRHSIHLNMHTTALMQAAKLNQCDWGEQWQQARIEVSYRCHRNS